MLSWKCLYCCLVMDLEFSGHLLPYRQGCDIPCNSIPHSQSSLHTFLILNQIPRPAFPQAFLHSHSVFNWLKSSCLLWFVLQKMLCEEFLGLILEVWFTKAPLLFPITDCKRKCTLINFCKYNDEVIHIYNP